jgi:hypothetical protein
MPPGGTTRTVRLQHNCFGRPPNAQIERVFGYREALSDFIRYQAMILRVRSEPT